MQHFSNLTALAAIMISACAACSHKPAPTDAVVALADRVAPGLAGHIEFVRTGADSIYFTITDLPDGRLRLEGNDNVSLAVGLNHYIRDFLHQQISWANPSIVVPDTLPAVGGAYGASTTLPWRYYLNYCTHSYSMAFWDWDRWQQEIDWMALHGINLPLAATGMEAVWRTTLSRLGYDRDEIAQFIAGPGYQAWWLMNNLEGWGGPVDDAWIDRNRDLQRQIVDRMRQLDMHPVFPGYAGMVPHDARERLGFDVADPGLWCAFNRPAFLQPADPAFGRVAQIYYQSLTDLYGTSSHYSMDPFHEGGNTGGVDLAAAGDSILQAMRRVNPEAVWVIQGWQGNPDRRLIDRLPQGSLLILDLWSESAPQWRSPRYGSHDRIQCLLLNYGGNVGLHGKMRHTVDEYAASVAPGASAAPLTGVGATMEGIENNEVMFDLMFDLPWHPQISSTPDGLDRWLDAYVAARYGDLDTAARGPLRHAWSLLQRSVYNCPAESRQQGTTESLFCARPAPGVANASAWANASVYWDMADVARAAEIFDSIGSACISDAPNFIWDRTDIVRQAIADRGRLMLDSVMADIAAADTVALRRHGDAFLALILEQDNHLSGHSGFNAATWLGRAANAAAESGSDPALLDWNARTLITVWGDRRASEDGCLHDYGNREWAGLLREFYYPRWQLWLNLVREAIARGDDPATITPDWYEIESAWAHPIN